MGLLGLQWTIHAVPRDLDDSPPIFLQEFLEHSDGQKRARTRSRCSPVTAEDIGIQAVDVP